MFDWLSMLHKKNFLDHDHQKDNLMKFSWNTILVSQRRVRVMYSCIWSMKSFRNIVISARVPRIYSKWGHEVNGMSWIVLRAHMRLSIVQTYFWLTRIVYLNTICFYLDFYFQKWDLWMVIQLVPVIQTLILIVKWQLN